MCFQAFRWKTVIKLGIVASLNGSDLMYNVVQLHYLK